MKMMKLCVLAAVCLCAQAVSAAPVSVLLEQGIYIEETVGDLDRAIGIYQQIVDDDKANRKYVAEALYRLGCCRAAQGQTKEALEELRKVTGQFSDQKELVQRAKEKIAELSPKPRFAELDGCRLKYSLPLNRRSYSQTVNMFYQTDKADVHWGSSRSSGIAVRYDVSLVPAVGGEAIVLAKGLPGATRSGTYSFDDVPPGEYVLQVEGHNSLAQTARKEEVALRVEPTIRAQLSLNQIMSNGDIHFTSAQQNPNVRKRIESNGFINSDFVHIEEMFDGNGDEIEFTETHEGSIYRYHATLNQPVEKGGTLLMGTRGRKEGMVSQVATNEFRYRMHHTPGTGEPVRRVEIFRLPAGAELLETTPDDLPRRIVDGQVELLVDTIIPAGGSLLTEFSYRQGMEGVITFPPSEATAYLDMARDIIHEQGWELVSEKEKRTGRNGKSEYVTMVGRAPDGNQVWFTAMASPTRAVLEIRTADDFPLSPAQIMGLVQNRGSGLKLQSPPWHGNEVLRYRLLTKAGMEIGTQIWALNDVELDGKECWKFENRLVVPSAGSQVASQVVVDKKSFAPLAASSRHSLGAVEAQYLPGKVVLKNEGADTSREVVVLDPIYDNEQVLYLMRRLPLKESYSASFPIMVVISGASGLEGRIRVVGREEIEIASEMHDCWKIRIEVYVGTMKAIEQMTWFTVDGHVPVRLVTDQVDMELVGINNKAKTSMELKEHAASVRLPEDWFGYELPTVGSNSEIVRFLPPEMKLDAMLCKTVRQPAAISVQEIVEKENEVLKGYFKNYAVREATVADKEINGMPARIFAADYEDQGKAKVEYRAYYVAGSKIFWFVFRMDADQFDEAKAELDELIEGLETTGAKKEQHSQAVPVTLEFRAGDLAHRKGWENKAIERSDETIYVSPEVALSNADVASSRVVQEAGKTRIDIIFTTVGAKKFAALTKDCIGKPLCILVDGQLISAPEVRGIIKGGRASIAGVFSVDEAQRISDGITVASLTKVVLDALESSGETEPAFLTLKLQGSDWWIKDRKLSKAELASIPGILKQHGKDSYVHLEAPKDARHEQLNEVLRILTKAGIHNVSYTTATAEQEK